MQIVYRSVSVRRISAAAVSKSLAEHADHPADIRFLAEDPSIFAAAIRMWSVTVSAAFTCLAAISADSSVSMARL